MFRQLLAAWRKKDPLKEMYESLIGMIEAGKWMFEVAWGAAIEGKVRPELKESIYRRDIEVNRTERRIRRQIVEHLSVQPGVDVPACLVLMSVVKDAERVGDYCKNILDASGLQGRSIAECDRYEAVSGLAKDICTMFDKTARALAKSDETLGHEVILEERDVGASCDVFIEGMAKSELPASVAVPWALLVRYLKRVSAHLGNMASSLVMPLHKLDYFDEKHLPGRHDDDRDD